MPGEVKSIWITVVLSHRGLRSSKTLWLRTQTGTGPIVGPVAFFGARTGPCDTIDAMAWKLAMTAWLVVAGAAGCDFGVKEFTCSIDTECPAAGGEYGQCVKGHCAFRSSTCASGFVYDESAGDDANKCVPAEDLQTDAGPPAIDAGPLPDAAPTPDAAVPGPDGAATDGGAPDA